jgi:hypothetical protein
MAPLSKAPLSKAPLSKAPLVQDPFAATGNHASRRSEPENGARVRNIPGGLVSKTSATSE